MRDFSYAARAPRRSSGFTVTAIAVLALGIGTITAIFSVPYPDPDRLVQLVSASQLGNQNVASIPKFVVWRDSTNVFQDMAAYDVGGATVNFTQGDFSDPQSSPCVRRLFPPVRRENGLGADVLQRGRRSERLC
jgi:hypothetical protein